MSPVYEMAEGDQRAAGIEAAQGVVDDGGLVVLPTDTVYGIGANPFDQSAVKALLEAKGRGRDKPSAVLVPSMQTVDGLALGVPSYARRLMERFWPGALTLIFRAQPSLMWDLGDTNGTVGLRQPDDEIARALLEKTGPLAVTSANRTGEPAATTITEAGFAFGPAVAAYLDGGERTGGVPSTILDCTKPDPVLLRRGAISVEELAEVLGPVEVVDGTAGPRSERQASAPMDGDATFGEASGVEVERSSAADIAGAGAAFRAAGDDSDGVEGAADPTEPPTRGRMPEAAHEEPTRAVPLGGVGAEPPFEREPVTEVELPGRPGDRTN